MILLVLLFLFLLIELISKNYLSIIINFITEKF